MKRQRGLYVSWAGKASRRSISQASATEEQRQVELGRYLREVRTGEYWRVDKVRSFGKFLGKEVLEGQALVQLPKGRPRFAASHPRGGSGADRLDQGRQN